MHNGNSCIQLNASVQCVDRHLEERGDQTAILWEGDDARDVRHVTYKELYTDVCKAANVLKQLGVQKGDRVSICMPNIPETVATMLACARIGAIHSVIFAGFSSEAIAGRLIDCDSKLIVTTDESIRGGKTIPLKHLIDDAIKMIRQEDMSEMPRVLVHKRTGNPDVPFDTTKDVWYEDICSTVDSKCDPELMGAEDPLFILYTSGSTGKPKGK